MFHYPLENVQIKKVMIKVTVQIDKMYGVTVKVTNEENTITNFLSKK